MIIPVIMAIWFGITAHKARRNWFGWALLGTLLSFIINTIILNINTIILNVEGSMFGSFSSLDRYNYFLDSYDYFRIVCLFLEIAANSVLGTVITSGLRKHATPSQYENTYREEKHQPKRDSTNPITLTLGILIIVFLSGAVIYQYLHPECNGKIVACITEHLEQK
jgi:hypothetical protein